MFFKIRIFNFFFKIFSHIFSKEIEKIVSSYYLVGGGLLITRAQGPCLLRPYINLAVAAVNIVEGIQKSEEFFNILDSYERYVRVFSSIFDLESWDIHHFFLSTTLLSSKEGGPILAIFGPSAKQEATYWMLYYKRLRGVKNNFFKSFYEVLRVFSEL